MTSQKKALKMAIQLVIFRGFFSFRPLDPKFDFFPVNLLIKKSGLNI